MANSKIKNKNNIIYIKNLDDNNRIEIKFRRIKTHIRTNSCLRLKTTDDIILIKVLSCDLNTRIIVAKKFKPCIYVWTTASLKAFDIYKVGLVNWQSVNSRLKQTDTTGVIENIEFIEDFELDIYDPKISFLIESEIHNRIGKVRKNREGVKGDYKTVIRPTIEKVIREFKAKHNLFIDTPTPRYYQHNAALIASDYYKNNDRGWIQWTCGTGKSYGGYWIYKSVRETIGINNNVVVIFVPNRQLVVQTHDDWCMIAQSYGDKIRTQKVGGVENGVDDVGKLIRWMQDSTPNTLNLIVSTYQSYNNVSIALKSTGMKADFVINDEVHRLTGSEDKTWCKCLLDSEIPSRKRLSMTASPIEYTEESVGYNGLENTNLYGDRFHKYLFLDAQFDGYIAPLEILGIEINGDTIERIKYLIDKNKDIIQQNLYGDINIDIVDIYEDVDIARGNPSFFIQLHNTLIALKTNFFAHPIIYANSVKRIRMFMACLIAMAPEYDVVIDFHDIFTAKDNIKDRIRKLDNKFAKSKIGVVGNVYCLQEGISINEVDGIVLIDPRSSGPSIIQIIGRPIRLDENNPNKIAKILLPIILSRNENGNIIVNNEYLKDTRDWILSICADDKDFENLIIENLTIFSEKSREGIDVREILPNEGEQNSISGRNRNLDTNNNIEPETIDFAVLKEQFNISSFLSTNYSKDIKRNTKDGREELLNRKAVAYIVSYKDKIDNYISNFNPKQVKRYSLLIKSKNEHIRDFSQINNIDMDICENLLLKYNLDDLVKSSNELKNKNILSAFSSLIN